MFCYWAQSPLKEDNTFIDYFINAITAENGISYNTQIAYRNDLIGFLKFLKNNQSKNYFSFFTLVKEKQIIDCIENISFSLLTCFKADKLNDLELESYKNNLRFQVEVNFIILLRMGKIV